MIRLALTLTVLVAGAALVATASGGPPPPQIARIGVAHTRPVSGHTFTGLTITPAGSAAIQEVFCEAQAPRLTLRGRKHRFYAAGVAGPSAVTCGWQIPRSAHGSLSVQVSVVTDQGTITAPNLSWRIRH